MNVIDRVKRAYRAYEARWEKRQSCERLSRDYSTLGSIHCSLSGEMGLGTIMETIFGLDALIRDVTVEEMEYICGFGEGRDLHDPFMDLAKKTIVKAKRLYEAGLTDTWEVER